MLTSTGATGSSYTLVAADAGKAITVRVSFTDDGGNEESLTSGPTAAVAEAAPTEPPPAPQNLTAVVNGDGNIVLSWVAPDDGQVTGYRILRRRPILGEDVLLEYVANTRSTAATFTDTNVTAGVQHVYRVQAISAAGQSQRSNYVNVDPVGPGTAPGSEKGCTHVRAARWKRKRVSSKSARSRKPLSYAVQPTVSGEMQSTTQEPHAL